MIKVLEAVSTLGALVMAATPLLAVSSLAHAQEATLQPQTIQVADLDLNRPADVARFNVRVDQAAARMCASRVEMGVNAACRQAVREEAGAKLDVLRARSADAALGRTWTLAGR